METFEAYLAKMEDPQQRARMAEVLVWATERFPELVPRIAWNQPMLTHHGTFIMGFSVSKKHLAVAPERAGIERFSADIHRAGYEHSLELVRLPWNRPVDYGLLERMITYNMLQKADCATFWRKGGHTG